MRNDALIPLSREHHYALVFCRTLERGAPRADEAWLAKWQENARRFFASDLREHFRAEEEVLFPACRALALGPLVDELIAEHRDLEARVASLDGREALLGLAVRLRDHIRKEERELFEAVDQGLEGEAARAVRAGVRAIVGEAACPRHPEWIEERRSS
jgi:hemerythrin-like domain-containing protein